MGVPDRAMEAWYHPVHCMNDPQSEGHMASYIGRRKFLATLGGAAAWPLVARAQQSERMRHIGVLLPAAANDPEFQAQFGAFLQALALLGWTIGRNVRIDTRWANGQCCRDSQTRGGIGRARTGRHPGHWHLDRGAIAAGNPHSADRVPGHW